MKQTKVTTAAIADSITYVPLADLYLHALNPRQEADPERIASLAASIRAIRRHTGSSLAARTHHPKEIYDQVKDEGFVRRLRIGQVSRPTAFPH